MTYAADGQRRRGRPPRISRDHIVDAACEVGIENLTMAAVAERLGVTHQSLYGWVQDRDELIDLVSDRLIRRIEILPPADPADWRDSLRSYANGLRRLAEDRLAVGGEADLTVLEWDDANGILTDTSGNQREAGQWGAVLTVQRGSTHAPPD